MNPAIRDLGVIATSLEKQAHDAEQRHLRDGGATVRYFNGLALRIRQAIRQIESQGHPFEFKGKHYMRVAGQMTLWPSCSPWDGR